MTLLQEELDQWQTSRIKSEQIAWLQSEITAMETALKYITGVTIYSNHSNHWFRLVIISKKALLEKEQEPLKSM